MFSSFTKVFLAVRGRKLRRWWLAVLLFIFLKQSDKIVHSLSLQRTNQSNHCLNKDRSMHNEHLTMDHDVELKNKRPLTFIIMARNNNCSCATLVLSRTSKALFSTSTSAFRHRKVQSFMHLPKYTTVVPA